MILVLTLWQMNESADMAKEFPTVSSILLKGHAPTRALLLKVKFVSRTRVSATNCGMGMPQNRLRRRMRLFSEVQAVKCYRYSTEKLRKLS